MDDRRLRTLIHSLTGGVAAGLTFGIGLPAAADAAEPVRTPTSARIGSMSQPVLVISREDIRRSGRTTLGDLLRSVPGVGPGSRASRNNGGDGTAALELLRLGIERALVLVDGRRWTGTVATSGVSMHVDLDQFPLARLERIEVLRDSASAAYGSDAIGGVVNLVTRRAPDGIEALALRGAYDEGDGEETLLDLTVATSWSGGRMQASASSHQAQPVWGGDRRISSEPLWGTGVTLGSSTTPAGRFRIPDAGTPFSGAGATRDTGGDFTPSVGDFRSYTAADAYNAAPDNYLSAPTTHRALSVRVEQWLGDLDAALEFWHLERDSEQHLTAYPLIVGSLGARAGGVPIGIHATQPFNIFGVDLAPVDADPGLFLNALQRRLVESGGRDFVQATESQRLDLSLRGSLEFLGRGLDWRFQHTRTDADGEELARGQFDLARVAVALGPVATCTAPCVPLNLFGGAGSITGSMLEYIGMTLRGHSERRTQETSLSADTELVALPAGPLHATFGVTRRSESGSFVPDPRVAAGDTTAATLATTHGSFALSEVHAGFAVPLLADAAFAEHLDLDLALRRSDLERSGALMSTGLGLRWQPTRNVTFRASQQDGFRAPGIEDLFRGTSITFPTLADPCSNVLSSGEPQRIANCTGVVSGGAAPEITGPYVPASGSYVQSGAQIGLTVGGNPGLDPESAASTRFGMIWTPAWVEGLSIELDHWQVEIEDMQVMLSASGLLRGCYLASRQRACDLVSRFSSGDIDDVRLAPLNAGHLESQGIDLRLVWDGAVAGLPGTWRVAWDTQYLDEYREQDFSTGSAFPVFFPTPDTYPKFTARLAVDWRVGDWEAAWRARFIGRHYEFCSSSYTAIGFPCSDVGASLNAQGATTYHDVQVSYVISDWDTRISFGVRNLGDKRPPLSAHVQPASHDTLTYEVPGRFPYLRIAREF